jgi:hypothetical protein
MTAKVIPFGKYKGQPVEVLQADPGYVDWLRSTDWVQQRFPELHTLIINNFADPSETPAHNAIQARFLDRVFAANVFELARPGLVDRAKVAIVENWIQSIADDKEQLEKMSNYEQQQTRLEESILRRERNMNFDWCFDLDARFEHSGIDVLLTVKIWRGEKTAPFRLTISTTDEVKNGRYQYERFATWKSDRIDARAFLIAIEIKPSLGDDFPAVMRQMMASDANVLFVEQYTGQGASREQMVEMMKRSNIAAIFADQVPGYFREV